MLQIFGKNIRKILGSEKNLMGTKFCVKANIFMVLQIKLLVCKKYVKYGREVFPDVHAIAKISANDIQKRTLTPTCSSRSVPSPTVTSATAILIETFKVDESMIFIVPPLSFVALTLNNVNVNGSGTCPWGSDGATLLVGGSERIQKCTTEARVS